MTRDTSRAIAGDELPTVAASADVRLGFGTLAAVLLLAVAELVLHSDAFLLRYRSVFAAGRAMDKITFVEKHSPRLLVIGDSRTDNGFDPVLLGAALPAIGPEGAFNLGMPGADARIIYGVLRRLEDRDLLGPHAISHVLIGLDEAIVQESSGLGYEVFLADRAAMLRSTEFRDWLRATLRLWGYADNLKELREPAKLERFARASIDDVDPVGGSAREFRGYRAGFSGAQESAQAALQEVGSRAAPAAGRVRYLIDLLDLLRTHGVQVAIVFPPVLTRDPLYATSDEAAAGPYQRIAATLQQRGLALVELDHGAKRDPAEFVNAGHLNDRGAKRYTRLLADRLQVIWPELQLRDRAR